MDLRLPALTSAEADMVEHYLAVIDSLGALNPARADHTHRALLAAQKLVAHASALRDALALMHERGETVMYPDTLAIALRALDAPRRLSHLRVPAPTQPLEP
jgi:hypothetical protein